MPRLPNITTNPGDFHVQKCRPGNTGKERLLGLRSGSFEGDLPSPLLRRISHVTRRGRNQGNCSIVTTVIEATLNCRVTIGVHRGTPLQGRLE